MSCFLPSEQTNTCSKSPIETLEKGVKCVYSKLTIQTPEQRKWRHFGVFIVNFEHNLHLSNVSIVEFEHMFFCWGYFSKHQKVTVALTLN